MVGDLRSVIRVAQERQALSSWMARVVHSTSESGPRAGYDRYKHKRGSKVHIAPDTLGRLLAVHLTPADEQERTQVAELARQVQEIAEETVRWHSRIWIHGRRSCPRSKR